MLFGSEDRLYHMLYTLSARNGPAMTRTTGERETRDSLMGLVTIIEKGADVVKLARGTFSIATAKVRTITYRPDWWFWVNAGAEQGVFEPVSWRQGRRGRLSSLKGG